MVLLQVGCSASDSSQPTPIIPTAPEPSSENKTVPVQVTVNETVVVPEFATLALQFSTTKAVENLEVESVSIVQQGNRTILATNRVQETGKELVIRNLSVKPGTYDQLQLTFNDEIIIDGKTPLRFASSVYTFPVAFSLVGGQQLKVRVALDLSTVKVIDVNRSYVFPTFTIDESVYEWQASVDGQDLNNTHISCRAYAEGRCEVELPSCAGCKDAMESICAFEDESYCRSECGRWIPGYYCRDACKKGPATCTSDLQLNCNTCNMTSAIASCVERRAKNCP